MEHLNSRFKLLVEAVRLDHTAREIGSLALTLMATQNRIRGVFLRLGGGSRLGGQGKRYMNYIGNDAGKIVKIAEDADEPHKDGFGSSIRSEQLSPEHKKIVNRLLADIQKNIQKMANLLKIELEEIIT